MSDLQNMADLVSTGNQLLDDIRGGAISRMAHEHQTQQAEFKSEHDAKSAQFQAEHNAIVQQQTAAGNAKIAEIDSYIANGRDRQSHVRLSKNQVLSGVEVPNFWSLGVTKRTTLLERVASGVLPENRTPLAREFLSAINCDRQHFGTAFNIWEIEIYPHHVGGANQGYGIWQHIKMSGAVTVAAIVKHISGTVPTGFYCEGLAANEPAKLCGTAFGVSTNRNHYLHIHPIVDGIGKDISETTVIQIALPAAVTGFVDLSKGAWGQFPYIGDSAFD
ncbi:hypothetical protein [Pseudoalteromonas sp. S2755]|uniref:hypothetical protein n=1 Tax=Pseudoalteromonas sp. S2755 TaxID=2066523 RepID=UPI00110AAC35|nr:hypothetical protein [Pseudoalteromonas sp. S2755]TMN33375.1 hypothetical protein CWC03_19785 [Pseudoalteromonas sp. S2755]